ncbi:hypothetical protein ACHQM5_023281 [Ranunculus cassubicifolius]
MLRVVVVFRKKINLRGRIAEIIEKQVLSVAKAVEEKIDEEISALERLDDDDIEALRERRLMQMKKMAEKRNRWISLGHGEYTEILVEKEFFSVVKASERVVCHFYRENWPCKSAVRVWNRCELTKKLGFRFMPRNRTKTDWFRPVTRPKIEPLTRLSVYTMIIRRQVFVFVYQCLGLISTPTNRFLVTCVRLCALMRNGSI